MLDDTCYFIPCYSYDEACFIATLLNSEICQRFLRALIFFDAKRPITKDILQRIDLKKLAERYDVTEQADKYDVSGVRNLDFAVKSRFDTPEHDQFA